MCWKLIKMLMIHSRNQKRNICKYKKKNALWIEVELLVARIEQTESVMRKHGTNGVKLNQRKATNNSNDSRKKIAFKIDTDLKWWRQRVFLSLLKN